MRAKAGARPSAAGVVGVAFPISLPEAFGPIALSPCLPLNLSVGVSIHAVSGAFTEPHHKWLTQ
ncbi:hypothetical protein MESS2_1640038 [Mesorhizobium metallidurans STM 2683]|uniref:Uncharacterized protein n=1 Tax=Mesorhizobium metallidurans STM 2683 TaxID=1297569 RepID=M5ENF7_9HYPH|nr:hypothetical protein MESS2_1640038 [Mesorhizobium metallidurans STM 2683]